MLGNAPWLVDEWPTFPVFPGLATIVWDKLLATQHSRDNSSLLLYPLHHESFGSCCDMSCVSYPVT
jgi:hypothetical protein